MAKAKRTTARGKAKRRQSSWIPALKAQAHDTHLRIDSTHCRIDKLEEQLTTLFNQRTSALEAIGELTERVAELERRINYVADLAVSTEKALTRIEDLGDQTGKLKPHVVLWRPEYGDCDNAPRVFECMARDDSHAEELLLEAEPRGSAFFTTEGDRSTVWEQWARESPPYTS